MPRKAHDAPRSMPCTSPFVVLTRHDTACAPSSRDDDKAHAPVAIAIITANLNGCCVMLLMMSSAGKHEETAGRSPRGFPGNVRLFDHTKNAMEEGPCSALRQDCDPRQEDDHWVTVEPAVFKSRNVTGIEPNRISSPSTSGAAVEMRSPWRNVPFLLPRSSMVAPPSDTRIRA